MPGPPRVGSVEWAAARGLSARPASPARPEAAAGQTRAGPQPIRCCGTSLAGSAGLRTSSAEALQGSEPGTTALTQGSDVEPTSPAGASAPRCVERSGSATAPSKAAKSRTLDHSATRRRFPMRSVRSQSSSRRRSNPASMRSAARRCCLGRCSEPESPAVVLRTNVGALHGSAVPASRSGPRRLRTARAARSPAPADAGSVRSSGSAGSARSPRRAPGACPPVVRGRRVHRPIGARTVARREARPARKGWKPDQKQDPATSVRWRIAVPASRAARLAQARWGPVEEL